MIVKKFPKNDDITIYPISDVHLGAAEYMANEWQAFCKKVLDNPNAYLVLGGDLIDNATKTSVASPWDNTMRPSDQKKADGKPSETNKRQNPLHYSGQPLRKKPRC